MNWSHENFPVVDTDWQSKASHGENTHNLDTYAAMAKIVTTFTVNPTIVWPM